MGASGVPLFSVFVAFQQPAFEHLTKNTALDACDHPTRCGGLQRVIHPLRAYSVFIMLFGGLSFPDACFHALT